MNDYELEEVLYTREQIAARVKELGVQITKDFEGREILLVGILKGSIPFMADLMREIDLDVEIDTMVVSSYGGGTMSSGVVNIKKDLETNIEGKNVILVEDIIDTGITLSSLVAMLKERKPACLKVCSMLDKPSRRKVEFNGDYIGFTVEDKFIVGYGLDYDQKLRQLPEIRTIKLITH